MMASGCPVDRAATPAERLSLASEMTILAWLQIFNAAALLSAAMYASQLQVMVMSYQRSAEPGTASTWACRKRIALLKAKMTCLAG